MSSYLQLLIFGALAAAGNLLGGFLITRTSRSIINRLKYLIALGAGFMMAAVFIEVMPEVAEQWSGNLTTAMGWLLAGYLLIQLAEHTIAPHFHFGEETHREELIQGNAATTAVLALSVHTFFDGVAIASGMMTSFKLGFTLFIAILLHKIPEGFTMASIIFDIWERARRGQKSDNRHSRLHLPRDHLGDAYQAGRHLHAAAICRCDVIHRGFRSDTTGES
ncbi:MAG: ZIP family metal transporter [Acidobacteria bacterium]|nr:ZIP family metal transporter [Acidobacteriota bacterium]